MIAWIIAVAAGLGTFVILQFLVGPERLRNHYRSISRLWLSVIVASSAISLAIGAVTDIPELLILGFVGLAASASVALQLFGPQR